MNTLQNIDEVNNISDLLDAYETLDSLGFLQAAELAMKALRDQISAFRDTLTEGAAQ